MVSPIRVAIIDDHLIFRAGVIHILNNSPQIVIVAEGDTAARACEISATIKPDVILMDIHMHGGGIEAIPAIRNASPATKIVMLTASESETKLQMAFDAGASGYVLKGTDGAELVRVIKMVISGETYITPTLATKLLVTTKIESLRAECDARLTARELEISHRVALGLTNKEIASEFMLTEKTVKHHMTQIMSKLCVRNRVELAVHPINKKTPQAIKVIQHYRVFAQP